MNEALRDWITNIHNTFYCIGSVAGPHPYPMIVRDFQSIIGIEAKKQILKAENRLPDALVACVGGGSNSLGLFYPFIKDSSVKIFRVEAGGSGVSSGKHAATLVGGHVGVLHGSKSYVLQSREGQVKETHSISAGLDYPGVGPEHSYLYETKRAQYFAVTDSEAMEGFDLLTRYEGIIPALESSHAMGFLKKYSSKFKSGVVVS